MIEKLARAIAASIGDDPDSPADDMGTLVAYGDEAKEWQTWIPEARACLEALREPSEAMLAVAVPEPTHLYAEYGRDDPAFESRMKAATQVDRLAVREAWQSMIDVALERKAA